MHARIHVCEGGVIGRDIAKLNPATCFLSCRGSSLCREQSSTAVKERPGEQHPWTRLPDNGRTVLRDDHTVVFEEANDDSRMTSIPQHFRRCECCKEKLSSAWNKIIMSSCGECSPRRTPI